MSKLFSSILVFFVFSLSTSLALASKADTPDSIPGTTKVTAEDIPGLFEKFDNLVIIDARIEKDRSGGHIEGAISLPDINTTKAAFGEAVPSKTTPVVIYCNGIKCGRSVKSAKMAVGWGYKNIYWFRGGWEEWTGKGMPIAK